MAQKVLDKLEAERVLAMLNPNKEEKRERLLAYNKKVKAILDDSDSVCQRVEMSEFFFQYLVGYLARNCMFESILDIQCNPLDKKFQGPTKFVLILECSNYEFALNVKV